MIRPSFEAICMNIAKIISQRATCKRLKVGTVITSEDYRKILAWGYNGNASGLPNTCDQDTPGACGCLHAEENAIINCDVPRSTRKIVFCTHMPCKNCTKRLINLGNVIKVYYSEIYRSDEGIKLLQQVGIQVEYLTL